MVKDLNDGTKVQSQISISSRDPNDSAPRSMFGENY